MPTSRAVVSVLLRALGDVSLHPQGRPCGLPPAALGRQQTRRLAAKPRVQCRADSANSPSWVALAGFLDVGSHPPAWCGDSWFELRQRGWTQSSGSPAP
jgi:hypothetical protein